MTDEERLAAEQRARVLIDRQLTDAGWVVQDRRALNLFAGQGVAIREVVMAKGHGRADYLIYVDQKAVGVIEAKPAGTNSVWGGVAELAVCRGSATGGFAPTPTSRGPNL